LNELTSVFLDDDRSSSLDKNHLSDFSLLDDFSINSPCFLSSGMSLEKNSYFGFLFMFYYCPGCVEAFLGED